MPIVRVISPVAPAFAFPQNKLSSSDYEPADETTEQQLVDYFTTIGWRVVDHGSSYYNSMIGWCPVGFHPEPPAVYPLDRTNPKSLWAIIPDGKTRKDLGI